MNGAFDLAALTEALDRPLQFFDSCESTQTEAAEVGGRWSPAAGSLVVANTQTGGRGRQGRLLALKARREPAVLSDSQAGVASRPSTAALHRDGSRPGPSAGFAHQVAQRSHWMARAAKWWAFWRRWKHRAAIWSMPSWALASM